MLSSPESGYVHWITSDFLLNFSLPVCSFQNLIENRLLSSVYRCKGFSLKFIEHHFRGFRNQTTDERSSDKLDKEASGRTVHPHNTLRGLPSTTQTQVTRSWPPCGVSPSLITFLARQFGCIVPAFRRRLRLSSPGSTVRTLMVHTRLWIVFVLIRPLTCPGLESDLAGLARVIKPRG